MKIFLKISTFVKKAFRKLAGIMIHWLPMRKQVQKSPPPHPPSSKLLGKEIIEKGTYIWSIFLAAAIFQRNLLNTDRERVRLYDIIKILL